MKTPERYPWHRKNSSMLDVWQVSPVGVYLLKVNNRDTRTKNKICSKLTIKTPERRQGRHSSIFIVNFEHILHIVLVFLLLKLNM